MCENPIAYFNPIYERGSCSRSTVTFTAQVNGDGTVIFRAAGGGKVYTMHNATCLNNFELTAGEGETTIKFQGPMWVETTS